MKLSASAHATVENFFREHLGEPGLELPAIEIHAGLFADLLMRAIGMSAITFGRHVFVKPSKITRPGGSVALMKGELLVHEAAHVLQYSRGGFFGFLRGYLRGYWRALRVGGAWGKEARTAAYLAIAEEREAREAASAFLLSAWNVRMDNGTDAPTAGRAGG